VPAGKRHDGLAPQRDARLFGDQGTRSGNRRAERFRWDAASGRQAVTLQVPVGVIQCLCWSPDGKRIAGGTFFPQGGAGVLWDSVSGQVVSWLRDDAGSNLHVYGVSWSPDGKPLASAYGYHISNTPGEVKVWEVVSGQDVLTFKGHADGVSSVCWSPDGKRLATGSDDKTVKVWEVGTGK
jgi:WD40 repeat protein